MTTEPPLRDAGRNPDVQNGAAHPGSGAVAHDPQNLLNRVSLGAYAQLALLVGKPAQTTSVKIKASRIAPRQFPFPMEIHTVAPRQDCWHQAHGYS